MSSFDTATGRSGTANELRWPSGITGDAMVRGLDAVSLVDYSSDAAFAVSNDMKVIGWNNAATELMGYTPADVLGQGCARVLQSTYVTGEPLCSAMCEGRACINEGNKWKAETCRIRHVDGHMLSVRISSLILPEEARSPEPGAAIAVFFLHENAGGPDETAVVQPMRIFSLGRFDLAVNGNGLDVDNWKRKQSVMLLKILVGQLGRPVHRERLIEWLWPDGDADSGWKRLKVVVSYLRDRLRTGGAPDDVIETIGETYSLRRDAVWIDSEHFVSLVSAGTKLLKENRAVEAQARFEEAASLYRGDYLEDIPYAGWCVEERSRLLEVRLELLASLVKCYEELGLYMEAVQACRTALTSDPCRENFARSLMTNLIRLGRADWAEREFVAWRQLLEEEYALEPTGETLKTWQQLVDLLQSADR